MKQIKNNTRGVVLAAIAIIIIIAVTVIRIGNYAPDEVIKPDPTPDIRLEGWQITKPTVLNKTEVALKVTSGGVDHFFVYDKYTKKKLPIIQLNEGGTVTVEVILPELVGIKSLTRSAVDASAPGERAFEQSSLPRVGRGKEPIPSTKWDGRILWTITAKERGDGLATLTVMVKLPTGEGPEGGNEAKYMPKIKVEVRPIKGMFAGKFKQIPVNGSPFLYLPESKSVDSMIVWLSGSNETGQKVIDYGLPKKASGVGSDSIILVPTKKGSSWSVEEVSTSVNETLSYLASNGYKVNRLYGEGFSAGAQGLAAVVASQKTDIPFTNIKLFGGNTNGKTKQLLGMMQVGSLSAVDFYVGSADEKFYNRVNSDYKKLSASGKASLHIVPGVGHKIDPLYAEFTKNTP